MVALLRSRPTRAWGNGIRPFKAPAPANNIRPITVKTWRPPVPEPLPPAPLLGLGSLLALGALVLAQFWGRRNPEPTRTGEPDGVWFSLPGPSSVTISATRTTVSGPRKSCSSGDIVNNGFTSVFNLGSKTLNNVVAYRISTAGKIAATACGSPNGTGTQAYLKLEGTYPTGEIVSQTLSSGTVPAYSTSASYETTYSYTIDSVLINGIEQGGLPEVIAGPLNPEPAIEPIQEVETTAAPVPVAPAPLPAYVPPVLPSPVTTSPGTTVAPSVSPIRALPPAPVRIATATDTTMAGTLVPATPAAVAVTSPDAHFPVSGSPPVTAAGARPSLEAAAREMGRLEQKVAQLLRNPQSDNQTAPDFLSDLLEKLGQILELLTALTSGGVYTLTAPCDLDEQGAPLVYEVPFSGSLSSLGAISNRIDALAELLQVHKDTRQPICRPRPSGQAVTVQFEQVE